MQIQIRDILRVERADVPLTGITLIVGPNGAGKSSLLSCVASVLTGEKAMGAVKTKKDFGSLVRRGAQRGQIRLLNEAGDPVADVTYPAGDYSTALQPPRMSRWAAGYGLPTELDEKARAQAFAELLGTRPTFDDLRAHMSDAGYSDKSIDTVWARLEGPSAIGWDETAKKAADYSTRQKGAWCQVTGSAAYKPTNALDWLPSSWRPDYADLTEAALAALETAAAADYETAMRNVGANDAELDQLRATIAGEATPAESAETAKEIETLMKALDQKRAERMALPATTAEEKLAPHCPECGAQVSVRSSLAGGYVLEKTAPISDKKKKEIALKIAGLDGDIARLANDLRTAEDKSRRQDDARRAAAGAKLKLDELSGRTGGSEQADEARQRLRAVRDGVEAWKAKRSADALHREVQQNNKLVDILAPTGLRKRKLTEGLEKLNGIMDRLSRAAGWGRVEVGDDLRLLYAGAVVAWPLTSESFEWRARATLQTAIALLDGSAAVLLDRADRLEMSARQGLVMMLVEAGIPAVVGMMCSTPAGAPRLWKAKNMQVIWLDNGNGVDCQTLVEAA